jgi:hypothetical protein
VIRLGEIQMGNDGRLEPAFVFANSTRRVIGLTVFWGLFIALGLAMVLLPEQFASRRSDAAQERIGGIVILVLFGGLAAMTLLLRSSGVALSADGVVIIGRFRRQRVAWDDIFGLHLYTVRGVRYLQIETAPPGGAFESPDDRRALLASGRRWWRGRQGPSVVLEFLGRRRADLLINAINRYVADPSARREIGTEAGLVNLQSGPRGQADRKEWAP